MFRSKPVSLIVLAALLIVALVGCSPAASSGVEARLAAPAALAGAGLSANLSSNASAPLQQATPQAAAPANSGITVMGVGQVFGTPDIAHVVIGIQTQNSEVKQAVTENNTQMTALISSLKSAGIADKDLQTSNYSVSVETPPEPNPAGVQATPTKVIYHVSNQVSVTVRDLSKLSDILDEAVSTGANSIYGVTFDVSNPTKLEDQARSIAVADAKARAEKLAQLEGVTLGSVISVSEVTANPVPMYAASMAFGKGGGAPIESGSVQVTVNLQVMYGIK